MSDEVDVIGFIQRQVTNARLREKVARGEMPADELDPGAMVDPYEVILTIAESFGEIVFSYRNEDEEPLLDKNGELNRTEDGEYSPWVKQLNEQLNGLIDGLITLCDRDVKNAMAVSLMMLYTGLEEIEQYKRAAVGAGVNISERVRTPSDLIGDLQRAVASGEIPVVQSISLEGAEAEELLEKILGTGRLQEMGTGPSKEEEAARLNEWFYRNIVDKTDLETDDEYRARIQSVVMRALVARAKPGERIPGGKTEWDDVAADTFDEVIKWAVNIKGESPNVDYILRLAEMRDSLWAGTCRERGPAEDEIEIGEFMAWVVQRVALVWDRPDLAEKLIEVGREGGLARRLAILEELVKERLMWLQDQSQEGGVGGVAEVVEVEEPVDAAEWDETELGGER